MLGNFEIILFMLDEFIDLFVVLFFGLKVFGECEIDFLVELFDYVIFF